MDKMQLKALAKINLGLDVLRRREDGYHEVRMIMQTVNLYDRLTFEKKKEDTLQMETNMKKLPTDGNNLIIRAASLLKEEFGIRVHALVTVRDIYEYLQSRADYAHLLPLMEDYMKRYCI